MIYDRIPIELSCRLFATTDRPWDAELVAFWIQHCREAVDHGRAPWLPADLPAQLKAPARGCLPSFRLVAHVAGLTRWAAEQALAPIKSQSRANQEPVTDQSRTSHGPVKNQSRTSRLDTVERQESTDFQSRTSQEPVTDQSRTSHGPDDRARDPLSGDQRPETRDQTQRDVAPEAPALSGPSLAGPNRTEPEALPATPAPQIAPPVAPEPLPLVLVSPESEKPSSGAPVAKKSRSSKARPPVPPELVAGAWAAYREHLAPRANESPSKEFGRLLVALHDDYPWTVEDFAAVFRWVAGDQRQKSWARFVRDNGFTGVATICKMEGFGDRVTQAREWAETAATFDDNTPF